MLDVFSVAGYAVARLYTAERLIPIALMVIPMLAGLGLGALILKLMSERVFRLCCPDDNNLVQHIRTD